MGAVDRAALELARGRVLDLGAAAGAHALPLVRRGLDVTALDLLPAAVRILRARGVPDAREGSVWTFRPSAPYDTVLALMNGTSLAGTAPGLSTLLSRLRHWLTPGGQLLIDSTELEDGEEAVELHYQLEYEGERGPPFPQLFAGERALARAATETGWSLETVACEDARFLARLLPTPRDPRPQAPLGAASE